MDEERAAELQELNHKITKYKGLVKESKDVLLEQLTVLTSTELPHPRESCFVDVNGSRIVATRELEHLLQLESVYDKLFALDNKNPHSELKRCLKRKVELLKTHVWQRSSAEGV